MSNEQALVPQVSEIGMGTVVSTSLVRDEEGSYCAQVTLLVDVGFTPTAGDYLSFVKGDLGWIDAGPSEEDLDPDPEADNE